MTGTDLVKADTYSALAISSEELAEVIEENLAGQSIGEFDLDRIKVPTGGGTSWEVPTLEGSDSMKEVEGVIVYAKNTRSFWKEEFSGGNAPPDCSSPDAQLAPASGEPGVPCPTTEAGLYICEQCPNAQFGTAKDGDGPGQACKEMRILFLLRPEGLIPMVVALPPTSVQPAKKFMIRLASAGVKYSSIVTKIGLEKTKNQGGIEYAQANFAMSGRLDPEAAEKVAAYAAKLRPVFERVEARQEDVAEPAGGGVEV